MHRVWLHAEGADEPVEVSITRHADSGIAYGEATIGDRRIEFECISDAPTEGCLLVHGRVVRYFATRRNDEITVWLDGRAHRFRLIERVARRAGAADAASVESNRITAPMPGTILKLNVQPGAAFSAKEPLIVMESMKMEMSLTAPAPGRVAELHCAVGDMVDRGALLATLELDGVAD